MEKPRKHYVVEVRGEGGLERTLYLTGTSAREVRERIVARGYRVVEIRLDRRPREEIEREEAGVPKPVTEEGTREAIQSVVTVILTDAASRGARTISLDVGRGVKVSYLVGEEWREIMMTRRDVWPALRRHLAELAGLRPEEEGELTFTHEEESRTARVTLAAEGARLELRG
jgi:hypothetical protein